MGGLRANSAQHVVACPKPRWCHSRAWHAPGAMPRENDNRGGPFYDQIKMAHYRLVASLCSCCTPLLQPVRHCLYGLVIFGHDRRRLVGFGVTSHPNAEWIARQVTE